MLYSFLPLPPFSPTIRLLGLVSLLSAILAPNLHAESEPDFARLQIDHLRDIARSLDRALEELDREVGLSIPHRQTLKRAQTSLSQFIESRTTPTPIQLASMNDLARQTVNEMPGLSQALSPQSPPRPTMQSRMDALPSHLGRISELDMAIHNLRIASESAWNALGYAVAGDPGGRAFSAIRAQIGANFSAAINPQLETGTLEWTSPARRMESRWLTRQSARLADGLPLQTMEQSLGRRTVAESGLRARDLERTSSAIRHMNDQYRSMTSDFGMSTLRELGNGGRMNLGGSSIYPLDQVVLRQQSELLHAKASSLHTAMNFIHKNMQYRTTAEKALGRDFGSALDDLGSALDAAGFIDATARDFEAQSFNMGTSHTLEYVAHYTLGKAPELIDLVHKQGLVSPSFRLPATFGAETLMSTVGSHIGSGRADIDIVTGYLDFANEAAWATVGLLVTGSGEGARAYQAMGGLAARSLREVSQPLFNHAWAKMTGQDRGLLTRWAEQNNARLGHGIRAMSMEEMFGAALVKSSGVSTSQIARSNARLLELNRELTTMQSDFGVPGIRDLAQTGSMTLGNNIVRSSETALGRELVISDMGINQYHKKPGDFRFFYDNHAVYKLPSADPTHPSYHKTYETVRTEAYRHAKSLFSDPTQRGNAELRLLHDVNTYGYASGDFFSASQRRAEHFTMAALEGVGQARRDLGFTSHGFAGSNAGRTMSFAITSLGARSMPFDTLIYDDAQVRISKVQHVINTMGPENIHVVTVRGGFQGQGRGALVANPSYVEILAKNNPGLQLHEMDPPGPNLLFRSHIYAGLHPTEDIRTRSYDSSTGNWRPFRTIKPVNMLGSPATGGGSSRPTALHDEGGVDMEMDLQLVGLASLDLKGRTLDSRPADSSIAWEIELPEE